MATEFTIEEADCCGFFNMDWWEFSGSTIKTETIAEKDEENGIPEDIEYTFRDNIFKSKLGNEDYNFPTETGLEAEDGDVLSYPWCPHPILAKDVELAKASHRSIIYEIKDLTREQLVHILFRGVGNLFLDFAHTYYQKCNATGDYELVVKREALEQDTRHIFKNYDSRVEGTLDGLFSIRENGLFYDRDNNLVEELPQMRENVRIYDVSPGGSVEDYSDSGSRHELDAEDTRSGIEFFEPDSLFSDYINSGSRMKFDFLKPKLQLNHIQQTKEVVDEKQEDTGDRYRMEFDFNIGQFGTTGRLRWNVYAIEESSEYVPVKVLGAEIQTEFKWNIIPALNEPVKFCKTEWDLICDQDGCPLSCSFSTTCCSLLEFGGSITINGLKFYEVTNAEEIINEANGPAEEYNSAKGFVRSCGYSTTYNGKYYLEEWFKDNWALADPEWTQYIANDPCFGEIKACLNDCNQSVGSGDFSCDIEENLSIAELKLDFSSDIKFRCEQ